MATKHEVKNNLFNDLLTAINQQVVSSDTAPPEFGDWAIKENIILDGKPFSFKRHEYLIEPYKDEHPFQVEIKATQLGLTSKALLRVLHGCRYGSYRGILYLFPSRTDVTDLSRTRLTPLIEDNPDNIGQWIRDTDSANVKKIWNSFLYLRGMKSRVALKCHDDKTEVLTKRGWLLFKDTLMSDEFATRSPSGVFMWQKPIDIYSYHYNGDMILGTGYRVNFCVTPNHRMLVYQTGRNLDRDYFKLASELTCSKNEHVYVSVSNIPMNSFPERLCHTSTVTNIEYIKYNSSVHCASVPNGTLYTRRNGYTIWSGNSVPIDFEVFDELDEAPPNAVDMALERMAHSEYGHLLFLSNPTLPDFGIDKLWQSTDQQHWLLKCPACNEYTNLVDTFPECLQVLKGRTIRACMKCGAELDPAKGEWVAKYPRILERRGRQYSQLFSQYKINSPENILHRFRTTNNLTDFYNLKIGTAYVDAHFRLSLQQVYDCCTSAGMESSSEKGCYMGVDQGNNLHVVIGRRHEKRRGEIIYVDVLKGNNQQDATDDSGWKQLDELMKKFHVLRCVVDAMPNTKAARNFSERFPGRVFLCYYNEHQKGNYRWNEKDMVVNANRTESLDSSHREIAEQLIYLPRQTDIIQKFAMHLHNVAKKLIEDDETGSQKYIYLKLGEDHFRHAFNYEAMARQDSPTLMFEELV